MAQKTPRIHVAEQETSQVFGAEPKTTGISGDRHDRAQNKAYDVSSSEYKANTSRRISADGIVIVNTAPNIKYQIYAYIRRMSCIKFLTYFCKKAY